jgi:hypothetical protein
MIFFNLQISKYIRVEKQENINSCLNAIKTFFMVQVGVNEKVSF